MIASRVKVEISLQGWIRLALDVSERATRFVTSAVKPTSLVSAAPPKKVVWQATQDACQLRGGSLSPARQWQGKVQRER